MLYNIVGCNVYIDYYYFASRRVAVWCGVVWCGVVWWWGRDVVSSLVRSTSITHYII